MKKVIFEIKLEVPEGLSRHELLEWIERNTTRADFSDHEPYDITMDWDSLEMIHDPEPVTWRKG